MTACTGVGSQQARNRIAQQDVAWLELAKGAAWWLGEYANVATGEFVGNPPPSPERSSQTGGRAGDESATGAESALVKGSGGDIPAEMIALQVCVLLSLRLECGCFVLISLRAIVCISLFQWLSNNNCLFDLIA